MAVDQYTKLLLHMDNSLFIDECGHTVSNSGVTLDTSIVKFGTGSAYFTGSNYLTITNNPDFIFGNKDFTIDFWICPKTWQSATAELFNNRTNSSSYCSMIIYYKNDGTLCLCASSTGSSWDLVSDQPTNLKLSLNMWQHVAVCRNGSNITFYLNGIQGTSFNIGTASLFVPNADVHIGGVPSNYYCITNIDEYRISIGIARWKSNFTPNTFAYGNKYLIQQGTDIYAIKSSFYNKIGQLPITEDMFLTHGTNDLTALTTKQTQNTTLSNTFTILGSGQVSSMSFNSDFQSINKININ